MKKMVVSNERKRIFGRKIKMQESLKMRNNFLTLSFF